MIRRRWFLSLLYFSESRPLPNLDRISSVASLSRLFGPLHATCDKVALKLSRSCYEVGPIEDSLSLPSLPTPIHKGGGAKRRLHKGEAATFGGRFPLWIPLWNRILNFCGWAWTPAHAPTSVQGVGVQTARSSSWVSLYPAPAKYSNAGR
jgi:hypothetical protein